MEAFAAALHTALHPLTLAATLAGSAIGIVFGAIPGLTYSMALVLVLPLTFGFDLGPAVGMLLGTYIGGMTGGSVSAILLGVPGTPSAAATLLDGHPMTRSGRAGLALGAAVLASGFGGVFSLLVMVVSVDLVTRVAIEFGPVEIFALVLFGLSTICGLAERSLARGLVAGTVGLMLMTVGLDEVDGVPRMTFGWTPLLQGVNLLVAMIGLFAVPHVMRTLADHRGRRRRREAPAAGEVRSELPGMREVRPHLGLLCRSSLIGTGIGAIPGTGGPIAAFLAYDHAKRTARDPSGFGKGSLGGVMAPEAANNAVTGGAMIPLLSLGIPGDPATAIVLGGLLIHGVVPGPMLFHTGKETVYLVYLAILVAYAAVLVFQYFGIRGFVRLLRIPPPLMAVGIIVMCALGSFAIRNSFLDIVMMAGIGLAGHLLAKARIPVTPIVLGLVLGPTLEREFRTAAIMSEGDYGVFLSSVPAAVLYALTLLVVGAHTVRRLRARRRAAAGAR